MKDTQQDLKPALPAERPESSLAIIDSSHTMNPVHETGPDASLVEQFQAWIEAQNGPMGPFKKADDGEYYLESRLAAATIKFYQPDLVEIMINTRADNAVKYYLHFQLNDLDYARQLFAQMMESFEQIEERRKVKVVISCTSGATSGYFAMQLNKAADALNLNYEFEAAAYWRLYEAAVDADIIMMAPQIGYRYENVKNSLPRKLVLMTPTALFASNDTYNTLQFLDNELANFRIQHLEEKHSSEMCSCSSFEHKSVLCIGSIYNSEAYRSYYELWDGDKLVFEDSMKRPMKYGFVYKEIIESVLARVDHLDLIMLGMSGVVEDYSVLHEPHRRETIHLKADLEEKYHIPVWLMNNANASVMGFSRKYPQYNSIVFHSQPYGAFNGGQGILIDGKVITGSNGLSGEIYTFLARMQFSNDPRILAKTDTGALEIVTKALLPSIGLFNPEVIALRSPMTSSMKEVRAALSSLIDPEFIPDLVYVDDMKEYLMSGLKEKSREFLPA